MHSDLKEDKPRIQTLGEGLAPVPEKVKVSEGKILSKAEQFALNKENGAKFEEKVFEEKSKTAKDAVKQLTIKTESGRKTKMDIVSKTLNNAIELVEAKASEAAKLRKNQVATHAEIEKTGGVVVGRGKPPYPGGTQIPPTKVKVVRPKDLEVK